MSAVLLEQARTLHRAGQLAQAIAAYRALTAQSPAVAEHWKLQGIAEHQAGDLGAAEQSLARAIALAPGDAASHLVAAHIAEDRHDAAAAVARFRRATELRPDWAAAWSGLGLQLMDAGRHAEALPCFERALQSAPPSGRLLNNLGMAQLALGRADDAHASFERAAKVDPGYALGRYNFARVLDMRGDAAGALREAEEASRADPRLAEAQLLLGDIHRRQRRYGEAERAYAAAASIDAASAKAPNALAELYWETGLAERARDVYAQAARRDPRNVRAALGLALLLPPVYASADHLRDTRLGYARGLESLVAGVDGFGWATPAAGLNDARWTNFYLAYQGEPDRALQQRYGEFSRRLLSRLAPEYLVPRERRGTAGRKLRVGFASFYFYNCTAGRYFGSWIGALDPARFETFVYYNNPWIADDTRAIAASASHFRPLAGRGLAVMAEQVLADQLDVLVYPELGMNSEMFTLAGMRLAPVQVAAWGHPTTTGLGTIDWYLSSAEMEPPGAQAHYSEKLALLPGLGTRYATPRTDSRATREEMGLPTDRRLYLVPQSIFKIHPDNDAVMARVMARDPEGALVFFAANHETLMDRYLERLDAAFTREGVEMRGRVLVLPYMTHASYLRVNAVCDVMLDTLRWSGGNTSLDALAMGLPVVTLPGELMRGRQSLGMLRMMGLEEALVARDADDYVDRAVAIARDPARRAALSEAIVAAHGDVFERGEPLAAFADFISRAGEPR